MWFTRVSLQNPVFATMVMLAFVVLGSFSYQRLQVDQFPNVDFPVVVVQTNYPGASPEIVESEVTRIVEEGVNAISGINSVSSRSYDGTSVVVVEFNLNVEGRKAADDVREKISAIKPLLPDDATEPAVLRFDPASQPIWYLAVVPDSTLGTAPSPVALTDWAKQSLSKRLENVRGVGSVTLVSGTERSINIELNPRQMNALGVTPTQVLAAIKAESKDLPVGTLQSPTRERVVQVKASKLSASQFGRIVIAQRQGAPIHLDQVASVRDGANEPESLALYNGQRTLLLEVRKAQDENTIAVVDGLNAALADVAKIAPSGVRLQPIGDTSRPIRVSVKNVQSTLIEGALLTIGIVFLFLNSWRSTVITGLTLPIAVIGTFLFMYIFGFTINMVTLMALSLCIGLLIDDAIVVRENIVRHAQMGKAPYQAAMEGTQEIGLAVFATTMSIVAVFFPIGFMGGIIGKFFHQFGITMVAAVLISMFVSFTLDPMLSSIWHDPAIDDHNKPFKADTLYNKTIGRITHGFDRLQQAITDGYQDLLAWSLGHKLTTLAVAVSTLVGAVMLTPLLGSEFVPKADYSETRISFYTPVGSSMDVTEQRARQVEQIVREFPEVEYTLTTINTGVAQGKIYASVYVRLVDRNKRTGSVDEMSAKLRERLRSVAGITVTHVGLMDPVQGKKQIAFSLQGPDLDELQRLSEQVMPKLRLVPGLVDLDSSLKANKPTLDVHVNAERAAELGLNPSAVAAALRTYVSGQSAGSWQASDGEAYDIQVRLPSDERADVTQLAELPLIAGMKPDGTPVTVRLSEIARLEPGLGANQINRKHLTRQVSFDANSYGRSMGEISADIQKIMDATPLPPGYYFEFGGSTKNMKESFVYAVQALALAIIFIYMILASQFKSFLQPLALMSSLPLTFIGVVITLLIFQSSLSIFSIIGVVMLMGLVTKNAILLVDFAIRARAGFEGGPPLNREEALLLAAKVRLRPIFMTTLAMVFGMVPLAFALSEGAEQRAPMGQAVIGGVITSSLLTLVVVPVVYCYLDDLANWAKRLLGSSNQPKG
ncbi:MAG: Multidrug resistance protein MdtC [Pseudomonadota bacterium]